MDQYSWTAPSLTVTPTHLRLSGTPPALPFAVDEAKKHRINTIPSRSFSISLSPSDKSCASPVTGDLCPRLRTLPQKQVNLLMFHNMWCGITATVEGRACARCGFLEPRAPSCFRCGRTSLPRLIQSETGRLSPALQPEGRGFSRPQPARVVSSPNVPDQYLDRYRYPPRALRRY